MKRAILLLILALASLPSRADELIQWFTDVNAALDKAKRENKSVLLDFTGSDWCGWCMKLKREVFDQPEFAEFAQAHLVLVEVDFPHHKHLDDAQRQANESLAQSYGIRGYPTIILLDAEGRQVGQSGYREGGPAAYDADLARILKLGTHRPPDSPQPQEAPRKPAAFVPIPPAVPNFYGSLALKGISGTKNRRMVLINNANLMVGESADVKVRDKDVVVCCKEIRDDSVLITVDGKPAELKFVSH